MIEDKVKHLMKYLEDAKISSEEVENEWAVEICDKVLEKLNEIYELTPINIEIDNNIKLDLSTYIKNSEISQNYID